MKKEISFDEIIMPLEEMANNRNNDDEKIIRRKYGEKMWQYCRDTFPTILEEPGLLSKILLDSFYESHNIYENLYETNKLDDFKGYIYLKFYDNKDKKNDRLVESPDVLLDKAGYTLYECKTENDIQNFKKYYAKGEELCTFHGGRLKKCHVYFAVKKNVDEIKRKNFSNPSRQDEYGTSVISIQFTKDESHTLSIKNRYNHIVDNPDATFSNNLDNIIPGLTDSFEKYYGMKQENKAEFEFDGYVKANDGKYYKYNYEIDNIYYCENNVIIDNFNVIDKYLDRGKFIVIDYFIIDLHDKKCILYELDYWEDSFPDTFKDVQKIEIVNDEKGKKIILKYLDNDAIIKIDKYNRIISYENNYIEEIGNRFLWNNKSLTTLNLPKAEEIGYDFLWNNKSLTVLDLPKVKKIGDKFLCSNESLTTLNLPNVKKIGYDFLFHNNVLTVLDMPKVEEIGDGFLCFNKKIDRSMYITDDKEKEGRNR